VMTVAHQLDRLGHDVALFADELGPLADELAEAGYDVVHGLEELPAACDAVLANDPVSAALLAERYRGVRLVYCLHGGELDVALPPLADGLISAIVAPSERFAAYARALALDVAVVRLTQPIDTDRFTTSAPPRQPPRTALLLGNYLNGDRRDALVEVWNEAGIDCVQVGHPTRAAFDVRGDLADADIVVAKGRAALEGMARLARKLRSGQPLGPAAVDGYLPRGIRRNTRDKRPAAARAVDLLLGRLAGAAVETELPIEVRDRVAPPPPVADLAHATIALVTEAGVVPKGNPDGIEAARATRWARYSIEGMERLRPGDYESIHGGYDNAWVNQDANRVLPVDALRTMERERMIGRLHPEYFVTCGSIGNPTEMRRMGREIAREISAAGVTAVILPAT